MVEVEEKQKKTCCQKFGDGLRGFGNFLYNSDTGEVLGRKGASWAKIGFFYLIFYGFLAGFFSGLLAIFLTTINTPEEGGPKLTQYISGKPGLTRLDQSKGNRLFFNYKGAKDYQKKIDSYKYLADSFLEKFQNRTWNTSTSACQDVNATLEENENPCTFERTLLGNCSGIEDEYYGLKQGKPCIFLKINKVYGWIPEPKEGTNYIGVECKQGDDTVKTSPPGFYIGGFPFRGEQSYELPIVSLQIDVNGSNDKKVQVDCVLVSPSITVSKSFNPTRSFGKIRIKDEKM